MLAYKLVPLTHMIYDTNNFNLESDHKPKLEITDIKPLFHKTENNEIAEYNTERENDNSVPFPLIVYLTSQFLIKNGECKKKKKNESCTHVIFMGDMESHLFIHE